MSYMLSLAELEALGDPAGLTQDPTQNVVVSFASSRTLMRKASRGARHASTMLAATNICSPACPMHVRARRHTIEHAPST